MELTSEELMSSWVVKMTHNHNGDLVLENENLKKSLEKIQNWFEKLRTKHNKLEIEKNTLEVENIHLKKKLGDVIFLDIWLFIINIVIWFLVSLLITDLSNWFYWFIFIIFLVIAIIVYFSKRLK